MRKKPQKLPKITNQKGQRRSAKNATIETVSLSFLLFLFSVKVNENYFSSLLSKSPYLKQNNSKSKNKANTKKILLKKEFKNVQF